jgi:hypothetical protein
MNFKKLCVEIGFNIKICERIQTPCFTSGMSEIFFPKRGGKLLKDEPCISVDQAGSNHSTPAEEKAIDPSKSLEERACMASLTGEDVLRERAFNRSTLRAHRQYI